MKKYAVQYTVVFMPTILNKNNRDTRTLVAILELTYEELDEKIINDKIRAQLMEGSSNKIQSILIRDIRFLASEATG